jgi:hypothetical protein
LSKTEVCTPPNDAEMDVGLIEIDIIHFMFNVTGQKKK